VGRAEASQGALRQVLKRYFGNSLEALVLNLLEDEKLIGEELRRIRELLSEKPQ